MISGGLHAAGNEDLLLDVNKTESALERMRGLLLRPPLKAHQGLLITPCNSVHTFFMQYPLDLVYIDKTLQIIKIVHDIRPWRMSMAPAAWGVLELLGGSAQTYKLQPDTQLIWLQHSQP